MKAIFRAVFGSKKAVATLAAIIVWALGRFGLDVSPGELQPIIAALLAYVLGQGLADVGKEARKVEGAASIAGEADEIR